MRFVLTFDDGYRSHFDFVAPFLLDHKMTATFYVTGSYTARSAARREPMVIGNEYSAKKVTFMTWDEVCQLNQFGFEIGNHLSKHSHMTARGNDKLHNYVFNLDCKFERLGIPRSKTIAYPAFLVDDRVLEFSKEYGFKYGRIGLERHVDPSSYQFGAKGVLYDPEKYSPEAVPCAAVFGKKYGFKEFYADYGHLKEGTAVLCFHDFGEKEENGLSIDLPAQDFRDIVSFIQNEGHSTVTMAAI